MIHILIRRQSRFRLSEQSAIGRAHRINADDIRPERRAVVRSRVSNRRQPKSHIVWADSVETHEDTGDDVRRERDAHPSHFSYDDCAMKRKAMYSCLSELGNQYLRSSWKKRTKIGFVRFIGLAWLKKRGSVRYERGTGLGV